MKIQIYPQAISKDREENKDAKVDLKKKLRWKVYQGTRSRENDWPMVGMKNKNLIWNH